MHIKSILIIIIICLFAFGNSFFNGFVGDDNAIIVENDFYHKGSNFPLLFSPDYITHPEDIYNKAKKSIITGSVAYRPALSLTYFVDYFFWKMNAFGYHLTNVVLHLINSLLVYFCVFIVVSNFYKKKKAKNICRQENQGDTIVEVSMLSALIFCIHPLKTEPVCSIGYRADMLSCCFVLFSFLFYLCSLSLVGVKKQCSVLGSLIFFFFGLFAKESVVVFPAILFAFDYLVSGVRIKDGLRKNFRLYTGYFLVLIFYLYVYMVIFPNASFGSFNPMKGFILEKFYIIVQIFATYILGFILPLLVKILPPVYWQTVSSALEVNILVAFFIVIVSFLGIFIFVRRKNYMSFFSLWFFLSFIPVSNIIPIANPIAYRFMYFPSIGLAVILASVMNSIPLGTKNFLLSGDTRKAVKFIFIGFCIMTTVIANFAWRNDFTLAARMREDYPDNPAGYFFLGIQYNKVQDFILARAMMHKARNLGLEDPRIYDVLGRSYLNDFKEAKKYFKRSIILFPQYSASYVGLGRIYLFEGRIEESEDFLKKSLLIAENDLAYLYLLQAYKMQKKEKESMALYVKVKENIEKKWYGDTFLKIVENNESIRLPLDFGI